MTGPVYNSNTSGGLLQGLGDLLKGLSSFNDPDKAKREQILQLLQSNPQIRDQYIQQFKDNPDAINALIGKKPTFGSPGSYNELYSTLQGKLSPQGQAAAAKANADMLEAQNRSTRESALAPILTQGAKVDAFVNRGVGGVNQPAPTEQTPGIENIPVVKGPGISDEDYQRYQEAMSGKILTPQERAAQQAITQREQMLTQSTAERIPVDRLKLQQETQALNQKEEDRIQGQAALAKLGKSGNGNLYEAQLAGKLSNVELQHIMGYEKGYAKYKDDMDAHFKNKMADLDQQRINIEQQNADRLRDQVKGNKDETAAFWMMQRTELAREKGANIAPISMDDARRAVSDPQGILNSTNPADDTLKESLNGFRELTKQGLAKNVANIYQKWRAKVKGQPADTDVNDLNNEVATAFGGTAFTPTVFGLNIKKNPWYKANGSLVVPIAGDPAFVKTPVKSKTVTTSNNSNTKGVDPKIDQVAQLILSGKADEAATLKDTPPELKDQLAQRLKQLRGDTTSTVQQGKPVNKPKPKPNFKADTTGLPPIAQDTTTTNIQNLVADAIKHDYPLDQILRQVDSAHHIEVMHEYYKQKQGKK